MANLGQNLGEPTTNTPTGRAGSRIEEGTSAAASSPVVLLALLNVATIISYSLLGTASRLASVGPV